MIINLKKIYFQILFIVLLFITFLGEMFNNGLLYQICKHIDEIVTLIFLIYIVLNYKIAYRLNRRIIQYWLLLSLIGLFSNFVFGIQSVVPIVIDFLITCPRFLIGYLATSVYLFKHKIDIRNYILPICKITTTILFILAIHDCFLSPYFPKSDYRLFMNSISLMFPHVTYLAFASITLLIFFGFADEKSNLLIYMIMSSFLAFVTLRSKAIAFVALYWLFYIWFIKFKRKNSLFISILGVIIAVYLAWDNIFLTFFTTGRFSPRMLMLRDGISLLVNYFPFGTGFGTYGTFMAQAYYSPLYRELGYCSMYGMDPNNAMFLSDTFWPSIFAQFGFFGTFIFCLIIVELIKKSLKCLKVNRYAGFSMFMCLAYLLVTSLAESSFWNPMALLLMIFFGAFENFCNEEKRSC